MKIAETYSHLNGREYLSIRRPKLWTEIRSAVAAVDAGKLMRWAPIGLDKQFYNRFEQLAWRDLRAMPRNAGDIKPKTPEPGETSTTRCGRPIFRKDRVAVEIPLGESAFVGCDLFADHLAFYVHDEIDVGIEILAMESMRTCTPCGPPFYEEALYNVVRNGRGVPAVPLVIVGVVP